MSTPDDYQAMLNAQAIAAAERALAEEVARIEAERRQREREQGDAS